MDRRLSLLGVACVVGAGGCAAPDHRVEHLESRIAELQAQQRAQAAHLDELNGELRQAWSSLFCGEKITQLFEDVDKECSAPPAADARAGAAVASCTTENISPAVMDADDTHRGMFLHVMQQAPFEAFPLTDDGALSLYRQRRLERLAQPRLRTTRFLVVSRASPREPQQAVAAARRARAIVERLRALQIPEGLIRRWNYNFQMSRQELQRYQGQLRPGEPSDVNFSVWVFRVNC